MALSAGPEAEAGLGEAQKATDSGLGRGRSGNPLRREPHSRSQIRGHSELKKAWPLLSWNYTGPEECLAGLEWEW